MKTTRWIILGTIACLAIAAAAYFLATSQIDALYIFRSPLHADPPAPGEALGEPLTRRVVFVLVDALRLDTSEKVEVMPFLNELRAQGAWATVHSRTPSYSDPGYSTLMTGAWPDVNDGPAMNTPYEETPTWTQDNLFSAARRAGLQTAVSGFYWFEKLIPQEAVDASFYTPGEDAAADREVVDAALPWLQTGEYDFILIHLDQVDYAGHHEGGAQSPAWDAAARRADDLLREIAGRLDLSQDTLLVVSDHGQIDQGGHGGQEAINMIEPLVIVGAGVKPGQYPDIQQVDIAPTVAALLGTNVPASAQGLVKTDLLDVQPDQAARMADLLLAQKAQLATSYLSAIGAPSDVQPAPTSAEGWIEVMERAKESRLNAERIPRFILAFILAAIPVIILIRRRSRQVGWLLIGALVYLVLFNLRYALLDGRHYSLSSVVDANDLISFSATTAFMALAIAWVIAMVGARAFTSGARRAAESSLGLTFVILFILSLPVLWSLAYNGPMGIFPGWTLPEIGSAFVGVLFTLQMLVVAAVGLVLSGVAALFSLMSGRKAMRAAS